MKGECKPRTLTHREISERLPFVGGCEALEEFGRFVMNEGGSPMHAAEIYRGLEREAAKVPALKARIAELESALASIDRRSGVDRRRPS